MIKQTYGFILKKEKDYLGDLTANPENIHAMLRLADIYIRKKKIPKAIEFYQKAAEKLEVIGKSHTADAIFHLIYKLDPQSKDFDRMLKEKKEQTYKLEKLSLNDIKQYIKRTELFKDLPDGDISQIVEISKIRKFFTGDIIIKQGELGDSLFIIVQGSVKIYYDDEIGKVIELAYLTEGDFFGEIGFMGDKKRRASVASVDDTVLIEISRSKMEHLIQSNPKLEEVLQNYYQHRILDLLLAINPVFEPLSPEIRKELIERFNLIKIPPKSLIIKEGDSSDSMYLIKTGEVKVFKEKEGEILEIARLGPGEFFGEIGLITGQKRTASIMSETDVELMELRKEDIDFIISKYPEILATLKEYIKQRTSDTFSKLMELKKLSTKKGLV